MQTPKQIQTGEQMQKGRQAQNRSRVSKWSLLILTFVISLALAGLAIFPPQTKALNTVEYEFASERAMKDIRIIAAKPHPTGSVENQKVRAYLAQRLEEMGLETQSVKWRLDEKALARLNRWSGEMKTEQDIFNIVGILPGRDRTKPALLLMAHHDTVWGSPGAADDSVGIASILEIIRAVKTSGVADRDLIILFTDGEEVGLSGARGFFKWHPLRVKIGAVINFEARGGGGTSNLFQTSKNNGAAARLYARSVKQPSASSLSTFVYSVLPNDTDLTPALAKDYVAYNIANIGRPEYYHSPKIDADALDERTLQHMGSQGLDLTRALLSANPLPKEEPDAVFFDAYGLFTIIYAPIWGWAFLIGAAGFYGLSIRLQTSAENKTRFKSISEGGLRMLAFLVLGGLALYVLNRISGNNSAADYYDRLAAIPKLTVVAICVIFSAFMFIFGHKTHSNAQRLGAALPLFILGLIGQILAPTASYFISLPLFICGLVSLLAVQHSPRTLIAIGITIGQVILSALVLGYIINLGHLLMLGVGPNMLAVATLPAAIAALTLLPIYPALEKRKSFILASASLASGIVLTLWVRLDPLASTVPLY